MRLKFGVFLILLSLSSVFYLSKAMGASDTLPEDELAQESVTPFFDNPASVLNRNVQDISTIDIGIFTGLAITEPIANTSKTGFALNYHFNYKHSFGLLFSQNSSGLSRDGEALKNDFGLDFTRAPSPKNTILIDYNYKMHYGKLSISRNTVINTSMYFSSSAGVLQYVHKSYPAIAIGIGEKFYMTNHFSLKLDLRLYAHNAPIPFKAGALRVGIDPVPSYDSFDERMTTTTNLEVGVNYLF